MKNNWCVGTGPLDQWNQRLKWRMCLWGVPTQHHFPNGRTNLTGEHCGGDQPQTGDRDKQGLLEPPELKSYEHLVR